MPTVHLSIEHSGGQWAIKHNGGYLGRANTESEARHLAEGLVACIHQDGREAELIDVTPTGGAGGVNRQTLG